ncbi:MAG: hypothetical protein IT370_09035 [Deltaproteobacteria bacterium]|nr:hypothetical protein [Deltaproteobacteria bacterium]
MSRPDELYVLARRVLLDALAALGAHRDAMVLVGAQAVYLRVGEADLAVAPFTTDGDLAIDPRVLADTPALEKALMDADFSPASSSSIGIWVTKRATSQSPNTEVAIDLLVPLSLSPGTGRRAARLPGHDSRAARMVKGLEGAVVDADVMRLAALDETDTRAFDIRVAGPAALLVAKVHKISDRSGSDRQSDKDALDVLRILRGTTTEGLAARYLKLLADARSAEAARIGRTFLEAQFSTRDGVGVEMAVRSAGLLANPDEIAASCQALAGDLLAALGG